jgi:dUTP pyrophosphatase
MKVLFKKLDRNAKMPIYARVGDAGADLTAVSKVTFDDKYIEYGTGISVELPEGYAGFLFPRSSVTKKDMVLKNSVGILDSGYRGEIIFRFLHDPKPDADHYEVGDRIGQIVIMPVEQFQFEEIAELSASERGEGGFGSSGH